MRTTGWPARSSAAIAVILLCIRFARQPRIDEQAILSIDVGRSQRLGIDGNDPVAVLAGRFGQQLLEPRAEIGDAGRSDDRHLVLPAFANTPKTTPSTTPGLSAGGTLASQERTIACVAPSSLPTSSPITAAGTRPKSDSTE